MTVVSVLPPTGRARTTYLELRKLGYKPGYALAAVRALEEAENGLERWASAVRYVVADTELARRWLSERGY